MYNVNFSIEFNNCVNNVKAIVREARHMDLKNFVLNDVTKFCKFMDDVNFKMEFVDYPYYYVHDKMLDAMDYLKDGMETYNYSKNEFAVINSIYDCVKEFYFNN